MISVDKTAEDNTLDSYSFLAPIYDIWQEKGFGRKKAEYVDALIKKHSIAKRGDGESGKLLLLDLGCGTGEFAIAMSRMGYDVIGVDISPEMLSIAREKEGVNAVRLILQDITKFELYGTVDVITCLTDTVNHVLSENKLNAMFSLCKNYLNPEGVLIFDVLPEAYFEKELGKNVFFDIREDFTVIWENSFDKKKKLNTANITLFSLEDESGLYSRKEEEILERAYSRETIDSIISKNKMSIESRYGAFKFGGPKDNKERTYYVVKHG